MFLTTTTTMEKKDKMFKNGNTNSNVFDGSITTSKLDESSYKIN